MRARSTTAVPLAGASRTWCSRAVLDAPAPGAQKPRKGLPGDSRDCRPAPRQDSHTAAHSVRALARRDGITRSQPDCGDHEVLAHGPKSAQRCGLRNGCGFADSGAGCYQPPAEEFKLGQVEDAPRGAQAPRRVAGGNHARPAADRRRDPCNVAEMADASPAPAPAPVRGVWGRHCRLPGGYNMAVSSAAGGSLSRIMLLRESHRRSEARRLLPFRCA